MVELGVDLAQGWLHGRPAFPSVSPQAPGAQPRAQVQPLAAAAT